MESAVALYFRLSQEDVDARGNSLKDESNSIQSQRFMLRSFIANHPDLKDPLWNLRMMVLRAPILIDLIFSR